MIDKAGAIPTIMTRLGKLPVGHGLDLRTFKRDRSIVITKLGPDEYETKENGFERASFKTDTQSMRKLLKKLLKKEFPRSNKIRVYTFTADTPD